MGTTREPFITKHHIEISIQNSAEITNARMLDIEGKILLPNTDTT